MINRWIVITSVYVPRTEIIDQLSIGYSIVVVGDLKTPHDLWKEINRPNFYYLSPDEQDFHFPELSKAIGFGTYARKNIGYLFAIMNGAQSIWDTDDDTYIRDGAIAQLNDISSCQQYMVVGNGYFNPYIFFTNDTKMWPRGYPLRLVSADKLILSKDLDIKSDGSLKSIDILQTLVNLEPDVDAIYRMTVGDSKTDFEIDNRVIHLDKGVFAPGNTQSTLWINPAKLQYLYIPRWVSFRFCDILKMYIAQSRVNFSYAGFWSEQVRNPHDYMVDFESEVSCYLNTESVVKLLSEVQSDSLSDIYQMLYTNEICNAQEVETAMIFEDLIKRLQNG